MYYKPTKFDENRWSNFWGSQIRVNNGGWSNTFQGKCFRSLFLAAAMCGRALSWRSTVPEDNIPCRFFWIAESNYSTLSTFRGRLYCFGHVYGLTTLRTDMYDVSRSTLCKASFYSHCGFNFATDRTLKIKCSPRKYLEYPIVMMLGLNSVDTKQLKLILNTLGGDMLKALCP